MLQVAGWSLLMVMQQMRFQVELNNNSEESVTSMLASDFVSLL